MMFSKIINCYRETKKLGDYFTMKIIQKRPYYTKSCLVKYGL